MSLNRSKVPLTTTYRVGSVEWENEFKYKINEVLDHAISFEDVEGYIHGLNLSYISGTEVSISTGACIADTVDDQIINTSTITIDLNTSGVNGVDTGSVSSNNWYYVWVIKNPTNGLVRGLFSLSDTSPTMPSGYTKKRLLGAVRYRVSTIKQFYQQTTGSSREFMWDDRSNILTGGQPSNGVWTDANISDLVPITSRSRWAFLNIGCRNAGTASSSTTYETRVRPKGSNGSGMAFSFVRSINGSVVGDSTLSAWIKTDSSGFIQYQRDNTFTRVDIDSLGFRIEV